MSTHGRFFGLLPSAAVLAAAVFFIAFANGVDGSLPGEGLFDLREDAVRTRTFASFVSRLKGSEFVQPIALYSISGPVWLEESWNKEILLPPGRQMCGGFRQAAC